MTTTDATWTKPGPGTWELDSSHAGPAPGPIQRGIYEHCLDRGFADGFAMFGAPLKGMVMRWVNGKFYRRLVPLIGGDRDLPTPPAPVLWLATRVHPAFRREERKAKASFANKIWRDEIRRWEDEWKPSLVKRNLELTDVDIAALDDAALADHLVEVHDHVLTGGILHFRLHVSDMGPLGNLMLSLQDWGVHRDETFRALRKVSYDGWLVIEAFGRALPALAAATKVWRDLFPSDVEVYTQGLRFMKENWAAHGK